MEGRTSLLATLPSRHRQALMWFSDNAGTDQPWPEPLSDGTFLATRAKGIYKPSWTQYALSVRQVLRSSYPDQDPITQADGAWVYRYFQENKDLQAKDTEYTNRGLLACLKDRVPVGVMRQINGKPNVRYHVLGLALVTEWKGGYFVLQGLPSSG